MDRPLSPQPIIAPGWVDEVLLVVEGRLDELGLARRCGGSELRGWGWCSCSRGALALPGWVLNLKVSQDSLCDIVLPRGGDCRHDRQGFATATAQRRILQPDFGYQPRPVAPALAQELIVLQEGAKGKFIFRQQLP